MSLEGLSTKTSHSGIKLTHSDYVRFRDFIQERSGLHFPENKQFDLELGLSKAMAASSITNEDPHQQQLNAYYQRLQDKNDPIAQDEIQMLINALTVGETHFFRDEHQFNALINQVLPKLIERNRLAAAAIGPNTQPQLRIWSAGCATGEEPYSLAILLRRLLPDIDNWRIFILATDINGNLLAQARRGIYTDWSFREKRAKAWRSQYFTFKADTKRYRLSQDIKKMVTFMPLNLVEDNFPSVKNNTLDIDLILCRNVTIYFAEETTRAVVTKFYETLVEGGWLVVGHAEPSLVIYQAFQSRNFPNALLYQKTGEPMAQPEGWIDLLNERQDEQGLRVDNREAYEPFVLSEIVETEHDVSNDLSQINRGIDTGFEPEMPDEHLPDHYRIAFELLEQGWVEEAIVELNRKLALEPEYAPAHCLLGRAYADLGQWEEAQQWCQSALALDNLQAEAYCLLGMIYQYEGLDETAVGMLKKAIYLDREQPVAHFSLGMLYKKLGQISQAKRSLRNTIRVLEKWPLDRVVPNSDGATAKYLYDATQRALKGLK